MSADSLYNLYDNGFFERAEKVEPDFGYGSGFNEPDWNADIFSDPDYLVYYEDAVHFSGDDVSARERVDQNNYSNYRAELKFFLDYFAAVRAGDAKAYLDLHDSGFIKAKRVEDRNLDFIIDYGFSPQRVYDITLSMCDIKEANNKLTSVFEVKYYILKNDGLFRNDIGQGEARAQYMTLENNNGKIKITDISFSRPVDDGRLSSGNIINIVIFIAGVLIMITAIVSINKIRK